MHEQLLNATVFQTFKTHPTSIRNKSNWLLLSWHLLNQEWKNQNHVRDMFKVNIKDTKTTSLMLGNFKCYSENSIVTLVLYCPYPPNNTENDI